MNNKINFILKSSTEPLPGRGQGIYLDTSDRENYSLKVQNANGEYKSVIPDALLPVDVTGLVPKTVTVEDELYKRVSKAQVLEQNGWLFYRVVNITDAVRRFLEDQEQGINASSAYIFSNHLVEIDGEIDMSNTIAMYPVGGNKYHIQKFDM